ncbi:MAG: 30S ribosome-binding factor RbfA [Gammaproteobacteria bacterium]
MTESKPRHRRIEGEMQRVLSELVARGVKDPRVGSVTITEVKIAADMSSAKIFFTPFASKNKPADVLEGLTRASGFLRGEVGRRLSLRHAPRLEFEYDDSFEKAQKLTELIDRAPK